ncbi:MAG: small basic family protein [Fimbriimonadaceae bacterium]|nr:small basic family protein [Fimbriimonadaceae bacterium]QYK59502.1 MAG: small basic family protein [Fimbriimonadaceae bacterium]
MILVPVLAFLVGLAIGFMINSPVTGIAGVYLGVAVIAGLDSVFGGLRSALEGKFHTDVFVTGFVSNVLIAFFLAWFGDMIGINVYFAAVLVMGWRIFTNLSLVRRFMLTRWRDARERRRLQEAQGAPQDAEQKAQQSAVT